MTDSLLSSAIPSGFPEIDVITQGWHNSDLIIIAARPEMGKTSLAINIARNAAVDYNKVVVYFSIEMSSEHLIRRLTAAETSIAIDKLRSGELAEYEWQQLNMKMSPIINAKLIIEDEGNISIEKIKEKCQELSKEHGIEMVVVDFIQLVRAFAGMNSTFKEEVAEAARLLKSLAKELDIPVIALSQLASNVDKREGSKKPVLSDLRESGVSESDADVVLFIYRPANYRIYETEDHKSTIGRAIVSIAKNKNGGTGDVELRFVEQYGRFESLLFDGTDANPF